MYAKYLKSLFFLLFFMGVSTVVNATELKRNGWNLIGVCADINRSNIDMTNIEEIQSQEGKTIYTGTYLNYSNLEQLEAGYGYWVKGNSGVTFDSKESLGKLEKPLSREGWNLMSNCEDINQTDINMSKIIEIQSQDGKTIYTGVNARYSNLNALSNGYGYWVKGDVNSQWTAKRGGIFIYEVINNKGEVIEYEYNGYQIRILADYVQTANSQISHTGVVVRINGEDLPILQIQENYVGRNLVIAIYDSNNELVLLSDIQETQSPVTTFVLTLDTGNCTQTVDTHPSFTVAKDNGLRELSKEFNNLRVTITTNGSVDATSNGSNAIYGIVDTIPTNALFKLNANYPLETDFVVKVYKDGKLVGISDEVTFNTATIVDFSSIEIVECN
jgi:signal peptidase I